MELDADPNPVDLEPRIVIGDPSLGSPVVAYGETDVSFFPSQQAFDDQKPLWQKDFEEGILPPFPIPIPKRLQGKPDVQRAIIVCTSTEAYVLSLDDGSTISTKGIRVAS